MFLWLVYIISIKIFTKGFKLMMYTCFGHLQVTKLCKCYMNYMADDLVTILYCSAQVPMFVGLIGLPGNPQSLESIYL